MGDTLKYMGKKKGSTTKYIVDVPNYDNEGHDVSGDHPHGGGRRRKDGTLETSTFNYVPLENYKDKIRDEVRDEVREEIEYENSLGYSRYDEYPAYSEEESWLADLMATVIKGLAQGVYEGIQEHPEVIDMMKDAIKEKTSNFIDKFTQKKSKKKKKTAAISKNEAVKEGELVKPVNDIVDSERQAENGKTLSIDEARAIFLRMLNSYISFRKDFDLLKNSGVVDSDQKELADLVTKMETLIQEYPQLLEDGTRDEIRNMLSDFADEQEKRKLLAAFQIIG